MLDLRSALAAAALLLSGVPALADGAGGSVSILRGEPSARPPARTRPTVGGWTAVAGETLWIVDRRKEVLLACRNVGTSRVGVRRTECQARRLPEPMR